MNQYRDDIKKRLCPKNILSSFETNKKKTGNLLDFLPMLLILNKVYYLPVRTALRKLTIFWRLASSYMPIPCPPSGTKVASVFTPAATSFS